MTQWHSADAEVIFHFPSSLLPIFPSTFFPVLFPFLPLPLFLPFHILPLLIQLGDLWSAKTWPPNAFLRFGGLISRLSSDRFERFLPSIKSEKKITKLRSLSRVYAQLDYFHYDLVYISLLTSQNKRKSGGAWAKPGVGFSLLSIASAATAVKLTQFQLQLQLLAIELQ